MVDQQLSQILLDSENIINDNKKLSIFFGKCATARLLEVFLNNPDKKLNVKDVLDKAELSYKAIVSNMPFLVDNDMILEEEYVHYKFYRLNTKNTLVKQISDFRNIVIINARKQHEKTRDRQVNTKSGRKKGRARKSNNAGRVIQEKSTCKTDNS